MNSNEIDELVRKYYAGSTSLAEEKMLSDLFLSGDYPPEYEPEAMLFRFIAESRKNKIPPPEFLAHMERVFAGEKGKENTPNNENAE